MIDKTKIIASVFERLEKLPVSHYLDLRTYKRNRSLFIVKKGEDAFSVIEDGYCKDRFQVNSEKLKKLLIILMRKEFPRSHKIRLYVMGKFTEEEAGNINRKVL